MQLYISFQNLFYIALIFTIFYIGVNWRGSKGGGKSK